MRQPDVGILLDLQLLEQNCKVAKLREREILKRPPRPDPPRGQKFRGTAYICSYHLTDQIQRGNPSKENVYLGSVMPPQPLELHT